MVNDESIVLVVAQPPWGRILSHHYLIHYYIIELIISDRNDQHIYDDQWNGESQLVTDELDD